MNTPEWVKPAVYGAMVGTIALAIVGFSWSGWVTPSMAKRLASDAAQREVVAVLLPICLEQSKQDPQAAATLVQLKGANNYERGELLMKAGWATMPGSTDPDRQVATACVNALATQF